MWSTLGIDDVGPLEAWLAVMAQMDPGYASLTVDNLQMAMQLAPSRVQFYDGDGFQVALRFAYDGARDQWQFANLGFVGTVTPQQALDLAVGQLAQFLTDQQAYYVSAVVSKSIGYAPLGELYDLALEDASLEITVLYESDTAYVWKIQYVSG